MRIRIVYPLAVATLMASIVLPARTAKAQACDAASARKLKKLNFDAMDENDRWELEKAKQKLEDAKLVAQSRGCQKHPELAVTYMLIGVVEMRNNQRDAMRAAWTKALEIDSKVVVPQRVQSAKILRLFAAVKATVKIAEPAARPRPGEAIPSGPPKGFEHMPLLKWEEGKSMIITARAAEDLAVQRISVFFKTDGAGAGRRLELVQGGGDKWTWKVVVAGTMVRGKQFQYFLVAYGAGNREVAASGNSASMHIVQLTSAAASPPRGRNSGLENPLTGGTYVRPRVVVRRRGPARPDHPLEDPDAVVERRRATVDVGVKKTHRPAPVSPPVIFASIGAGTGIGLMAGHTEITNEAVPSAPSLGSIYGQVELGYLITPRFSLNVFGRFGYLAISGAVKDASAANNPSVKPKGNDKDVMVLLRARYQSRKLLRADLPINLRWYAGGGLGWGIIRHLVNGKDQRTGQDVLDTDRSTGVVPNVFGGVSMCVIRSCQVSVQLEVNYLATFTLDTDLNTPFHLDFTLGANFAF